ncbi:MAG: hypothetical protein AAFO63_03865 [Pseudomonadota bacterium]
MKPVLFGLLLAVSACATASHEERESLLAQPINCDVADQDIAALEAAMPSRRERARSAVQSVTPVGVATGVVSGSYRDRASVLTGRTAEELEARIDEIKAQCTSEDLLPETPKEAS